MSEDESSKEIAKDEAHCVPGPEVPKVEATCGFGRAVRNVSASRNPEKTSGYTAEYSC